MDSVIEYLDKEIARLVVAFDKADIYGRKDEIVHEIVATIEWRNRIMEYVNGMKRSSDNGN